MLDPIDGTINFARDSPLCAISLSLVVGGQPVLGIVDTPLLGERFVARQGGGAYLNGARIAVAEVDGMHEAMVGVADFKVGVGSEEENRMHLALLARLARESLRVRMHGSAALDLAWLAAGRLNATRDALQPALGRDRGPAAGPRGRRHGVRLRRLRARRRLAVHDRLRPLARRAGSAHRGGGDVMRWRRRGAPTRGGSPIATERERRAHRRVRPLADPDDHGRAGSRPTRGAPPRRRPGFLGRPSGRDARGGGELCCALGGEPGRVLQRADRSRAVDAASGGRAEAPNGVYIHDRRGGERVEVVSVESRPLARHAADELYGIALGAGLDADVTLITGCQPGDVVDADLYRRLVSDLRANGKPSSPT